MVFKEYDKHRSVFYFDRPSLNLKVFIAIHRNKTIFPSFGATRMMMYANEDEALNDALRLSRLMSYKSALAGLNYGGAKGVILFDGNHPDKSEVLKIYSDMVNELKGKFITGADVGLSQEDVQLMTRNSPYFVGTKNKPEKCTALGIVKGIEVCLKQVFGKGFISDHTFAIQGLGKVGLDLLGLIYNQAGKIYVSDISSEKIEVAKNLYPNIVPVPVEDIFKLEIDVFCPCALAHAISPKMIAELKCKIVAGGANNQLFNQEVGDALFSKGILYAPDYVINSGGLISVADEYENRFKNENHIEKKLEHIKSVLETIFEQSQTQNLATNRVADRLAEDIFNNH